jgi:hypothetical protein
MQSMIKKCLRIVGCLFSLSYLIASYAGDQNNVPISSEDAAEYSSGYFISAGMLPPIAGEINGGYLFNRNLGLQLGLVSLWDSSFGWDFDTATIYDIAMRGSVPLGSKGEFFGKLGVGVINGEVKVSMPWIGTIKQTGESVGPTFALGLGYYFTRHLAGTIEYTGIYSTGSTLLRNGVKAVPLIGVTYHFTG